MPDDSQAGHSKSSKTRRIRVRRILYKFTPNDEQSLIELRKRLRKMDDHGLQRFIECAKHMCSPGSNFGPARLESFVVQLQEAEEELKRRSAARR